MKETRIQEIIKASIAVKEAALQDASLLAELDAVVDLVTEALQSQNKILFCGNGGSAADAQHISTELSGRFYLDREPLFAEALHVNSSFLTAVANDYGFEEVYARMVRAAGRPGDILVGISTSGNSPNILRALEAGRACGMTTIGMSGQTGGQMGSRCDHLLKVPSTDTPRIQEVHILLGHILCELVEARIFPEA